MYQALAAYNSGREFLLGQLTLMEVGATPVRQTKKKQTVTKLLQGWGLGRQGRGNRGVSGGLTSEIRGDQGHQGEETALYKGT